MKTLDCEKLWSKFLRLKTGMQGTCLFSKAILDGNLLYFKFNNFDYRFEFSDPKNPVHNASKRSQCRDTYLEVLIPVLILTFTENKLLTNIFYYF